MDLYFKASVGFEDEFNKLGRKGWEFVAWVGRDNVNRPIFKRQALSNAAFVWSRCRPGGCTGARKRAPCLKRWIGKSEPSAPLCAGDPGRELARRQLADRLRDDPPLPVEVVGLGQAD